MQFNNVYTFLINELQVGLPEHLTYHNSQHTNNVIEAATNLATAENLVGDELLLLKTAALFHDAGFLTHTQNHEAASCQLAIKYLPKFDYSPENIATICEAIMATKIPQTPTNTLGEILCDADLYYLGTNNYTAYASNLYNENVALGTITSEKEWHDKQINFLTSHQYYTNTAIKQLAPKKQYNLQQLLQKGITAHHHKKSRPVETLQDAVSIVFGVIIAGFALKCFLVPNRFFDGGVTGISLLLHELYHLNLALVIPMLNLPLIIVSYFSVGKRFALRTLISVILLGICLFLLPEFAMTTDKLLVSIFGGVFLGIGIGLIMRAGAALDGIEVLALYTLKKTSFTITEIILGINIIIFAIAAFKFGIETSLYSILTYFAATTTINYVVEGLQAFTGVTIISGKSEDIKFALVNGLGRGITVYKGQRGFLPGQFEVSSDCDIIFTVITRLEMRKLKNLVYDIDPKAFVFANTIKEASGGIIRRKQGH